MVVRGIAGSAGNSLRFHSLEFYRAPMQSKARRRTVTMATPAAWRPAKRSARALPCRAKQEGERSQWRQLGFRRAPGRSRARLLGRLGAVRGRTGTPIFGHFGPGAGPNRAKNRSRLRLPVFAGFRRSSAVYRRCQQTSRRSLLPAGQLCDFSCFFRQKVVKHHDRARVATKDTGGRPSKDSHDRGGVPGSFLGTIGPGPGSYGNPHFRTFWPRTGADYT